MRKDCLSLSPRKDWQKAQIKPLFSRMNRKKYNLSSQENLEDPESYTHEEENESYDNHVRDIIHSLEAWRNYFKKWLN